MDRKLGRLLDELDSLNLADKTAVLFHGDHGYHMGEMGLWRKFTNFELATRVPLIVRAPWLHPAGAGTRRVSALVELVDLLPSIAELGGLALPTNETFDGTSFAGLLGGGEAAGGGGGGGGEDGAAPAGWPKQAAFSQYPRRVTNPATPWKGNEILHHDRKTFTHMGYSIRTEDWRYTEWVAWNGTALAPVWTNLTARELYEHRAEAAYPTDFNSGEVANVAANQSYADVCANLSRQLRAQFASHRS